MSCRLRFRATRRVREGVRTAIHNLDEPVIVPRSSTSGFPPTFNHRECLFELLPEFLNVQRLEPTCSTPTLILAIQLGAGDGVIAVSAHVVLREKFNGRVALAPKL